MNPVNIWRMVFNQKTPLALLVLGQAVTLYGWQMHTYATAAYMHINAVFILALLTAIAMDGAIVQIAFAKKTNWLHWGVSFATSAVFTGIGVAIAVQTTGDILHAAFSVGIFLYSWFIAIVLNADHDTMHNAMLPLQDTAMQYARELPMQYPEPVAIEDTAIATKDNVTAMHYCPNCNAPVNASSYYRIKKRGSCAKCSK